MAGTPREPNISNLTQYLGNLDLGNLERYLGRDVNRKYGRLEVELAVDGWRFSTNVMDTPQEIESGLKFAGRDKGLETRVEDIAYTAPPDAKVLSGYKVIYRRGEDVTPRVPTEVVEEARDYLSKDRGAQLAFLRQLYQQIVLGMEGTYAKRFNEREGEIAAVANYFTDKLRDLGLAALADKLEAKVKEKFPRQEEKISYENKREKPYRK